MIEKIYEIRLYETMAEPLHQVRKYETVIAGPLSMIATDFVEILFAIAMDQKTFSLICVTDNIEIPMRNYQDYVQVMADTFKKAITGSFTFADEDLRGKKIMQHDEDIWGGPAD